MKYARMIQKGKTNNGDLCKQTISLCGTTPENIAVLIIKLVLAADKIYEGEFKAIKTFRGMTLYRQVISIRLTTLNNMILWINELCNVVHPEENLFSKIDIKKMMEDNCPGRAL